MQQGMEVNYDYDPVCCVHHHSCPMADLPDETAVTKISSPLLALGQFLTGPPFEKRVTPVPPADLEMEEVNIEVYPKVESARNPSGHETQQDAPMVACTDFELKEIDMDLPLGDKPAGAHIGKVVAYTEPEGHVAAPTSTGEQGGQHGTRGAIVPSVIAAESAGRPQDSLALELEITPCQTWI